MVDTSFPVPLPISYVKGRYLLFDIDAMSYIRRNHNICGVLIGTIPHISNQNVFLGLPLELMPEEARLLVQKEVAYIVNDVETHKQLFLGMSSEEIAIYQKVLEAQGIEAAAANERKVEAKKAKHFKNLSKPDSDSGKVAPATEEEKTDDTIDDESSLFGGPTPSAESSTSDSKPKIQPYPVTLATSCPPLSRPEKSTDLQLPEVPASYPLFAHLNSKGYFITPGLRFGCQYCVYPGDPLRYHSHFLANGYEWDEEFKLIDVIGGGRLGTAVKKAFMIGATKMEDEDCEEAEPRAFCIEWAGM